MTSEIRRFCREFEEVTKVIVPAMAARSRTQSPGSGTEDGGNGAFWEPANSGRDAASHGWSIGTGMGF